MTIIFGIIAAIAIIVAIICATVKKKFDKATEEANQQIVTINKQLTEKNSSLREASNRLNNEVVSLSSKKKSIEESILIEEEQLERLQQSVKNSLTNQQKLSQQAFDSWWDLLEKDYQEKETEYKELVQILRTAYANEQENLMAEADQCRKDLDKIRATRDAAIEAQKKEKEIKDRLSFYCLPIDKDDLEDIQKLEKTKMNLHKPRILSMLIWSTYFQKPMTTLCNNILGTSPVVGIYKITNQKTNECYIGQASSSVADRWKQHAKHGLGIDMPVNNKLYKAMMADGIWNFSWELLEKCPKEQLNEKEKFYIDLYQSYYYGYNSNAGISKESKE